MSTEENKSLALRLYTGMWNRGDLSVARELFARPEGVERFVREFRAAFPNLQHTVESMIAEGNQVAIRFHAEGTHTGPWRQHPASGKPVRYTGVTILTIQDGKIIDHHTCWDRFELIEQITS